MSPRSPVQAALLLATGTLVLALAASPPVAAQSDDGSPPTSPAPPAAVPSPARPAPAPASTLLRRQRVEPLPGSLDALLLVNDNNPELIRSAGILLSGFDPARGFDGRPLGVPSAHLNLPLGGSFELFSHHVFAGRPESLDSTLWLAVVGAPAARLR